jgi:glycosyltransferase involved in cell wall biosynthesis
MAGIDVLLPYWGDVDYFKAAVSSVVAQHEQDWRLVIVDDGYPSAEPAAWVARLGDSRITYHRNETNLGANANYRLALTFATAPLTVMMGADDVMRPHYLTEVLDAAQRHPDVAVIQPGVEVIDGEGKVYLPLADRVKGWYAPKLGPVAGSDAVECVLTGEVMARSLLRADWAYFPALAWRTETIQRIGFRLGLHVVQDLALLLDIAAEGGSMVVLGEVSFAYRRHGDSDSSVKAVNGVRFEEERAFFQQSAERFAAQGWRSAARAARWHVSSRLNAVTLVPTALGLSDRQPVRNLARHIFT